MQGVELEASGALTDRWSIHAGYSYLSPKIKRAATTRDDGIFLLMPRHSANLWTTYDITDDITVGGGVNAMSGIKSSQGVRGGGYATFDLMAAYRITPQLNLQMNVDNLFDRSTTPASAAPTPSTSPAPNAASWRPCATNFETPIPCGSR